MSTRSMRRSLTRLLTPVVVAAALTGGVAGAAEASTVSARAAATHAVSTGTPAAMPKPSDAPRPLSAFGHWEYRGSYPDPITCNIAGISSGRQYVCTWQVFWWSLWTWEA